MGAFHAQHVRGAPAHRPGHAAGHRGAVLARPAAGHGFLGTTVAKRAAVSSAKSEADRVAEPEFVAKPKHILTVTVPEPEFTGSDRLRRLAAIKPAHALAGSHSGSLLNLLEAAGTCRQGSDTPPRQMPSSATSSPPSHLLQPVVSITCGLAARLTAFCSVSPVQKQSAPSNQTATSGVTCGRPPGRTVDAYSTFLW
jgi:hypothetical protein